MKNVKEIVMIEGGRSGDYANSVKLELSHFQKLYQVSQKESMFDKQ